MSDRTHPSRPAKTTNPLAGGRPAEGSAPDAHEKTYEIELPDRVYAVVQEYAAENGASDAEAVHQLAVEGLAARLAKAGEEAQS